MAITAKQREMWDAHGYLVIEEFFDDQEVTVVEEALRRTWHERPSNVTVDDLVLGHRVRASNVTDEQLGHPFKVNDLYLTDRHLRSVASSERVVSVIGELLADKPVMCNTLNMEHGSQQADHLDTLYMTPRTERSLVATWMALEDAHPDAGPLRYWPGSHRIEPFRFSTGSMHTVPDEMDSWAQYMATEADRLGLTEQAFLARRGDLFIWDALLLHGGSAIKNQSLTRNSLVTHFWSKTDCDALSLTTKPVDAGAGLWLDRPPQPIPGEDITTVDPQSTVDAQATERDAAERPVVSVPQLANRPTLFERLRSLLTPSHH